MGEGSGPEGFGLLEAAARHVEAGEGALARLAQPLEMRAIRLDLDRDDGSRLHLPAWRCRWDDALGPTKGGLRFHADLDAATIERLAFEMTVKCALMDLPFGGAKGGVRIDPDTLSPAEARRLARAYARAFATTIDPDRDIPAPDVGTDPGMMAAIADEWRAVTGRNCPGVVTGKPDAIGGIAGRDEATARGGAVLVCRLGSALGLGDVCTIAVQGFGNVGLNFARMMAEAGRRVVAVSDSSATLVSEDGLDIDALAEAKAAGRDLADLDGRKGALCHDRDAILAAECDLLVPAALGGVIDGKTAGRVRARVVLELANGPVTGDGDAALAERGVTIVPDLLANAGGVTVSWFEWMQNRAGARWRREEVEARLEEAMVQAGRRVLEAAESCGLPLREAAHVCALRRLAAAIAARA